MLVDFDYSVNPEYCQTAVTCHSFHAKQQSINRMWTQLPGPAVFNDPTRTSNGKWTLRRCACCWYTEKNSVDYCVFFLFYPYGSRALILSSLPRCYRTYTVPVTSITPYSSCRLYYKNATHQLTNVTETHEKSLRKRIRIMYEIAWTRLTTFWKTT